MTSFLTRARDFSPWIVTTILCGAVACGSSSDTTPSSTSSSNTSGAGGAGSGGAGGATSTGPTSTATTGAGGAAAGCPQAETMLDVASAPGAGAGYAKASLTATCTATTFIVDSNGMPPYTFVQTTPNPLQETTDHWEITRDPQPAAATTEIPLLGVVGFAVNGLPFYGPNEAAQPADEAFGDPIYNGLMDPCLGHTSPNEYHYHSFLEKCLVSSALTETPWMNDDPAASSPSPIIGWALDGYPIYGPRECTDASCASVVVIESGYAKTGDPKTHAWDAYTWEDHADATHLDECNGHVGPGGDYHYHATAGFPYILGCYHGTAAGGGGMGQGGGGMGEGGGMAGPADCSSDADCVGNCPPGAAGCGCHETPMGKKCVPTCTVDADCPQGPMGMQLHCNQGFCSP